MSLLGFVDTIFRKSLTEIDLSNWIDQALPGESIAYHRGFLACDTKMHSLDTPLLKHKRAELARVHERARQAFDSGQVALVQRRHGEDDYSYLAIRSKPKKVSRSRLRSIAVSTNA